MTLSKLDIELGKIDMKFTTAARSMYDRPALEFFIRYSSPSAVDRHGEGIVTSIHRFKEDKNGRDGLCVIDKNYPLTLSGLDNARRDGLFTAISLYNLKGIHVVEVFDLPVPENIEHSMIYRLNLVYALQFLNPTLH